MNMNMTSVITVNNAATSQRAMGLDVGERSTFTIGPWRILDRHSLR
jgi:hypothetical protein